VIRRGRPVVDVHGVCQLLGVAYNTARQTDRPWESRGFPAPVNAEIAEVGRGGRTPLWDREQVLAYTRGDRCPELPATDHDDDLLELPEVANLLKVDPRRIRLAMRNGVLPDSTPCGVEHWRRARVPLLAQEIEPGPRGRPTRDAAVEIRSRLVVALASMHVPEGHPVNATELARRASVNRHTARHFLSRHAQSDRPPEDS
jgi:hypothetical protein